ncbi:MAG: tRNA (adenosine(37)-N6)-dimethylallyltransferase MiaA [Defluviitaleaceae bacterium]|nr:tRNA (adenosine(37)-N6)-dimethylallyltransferase MiaA [Defluviitaleaceae bacterium]
MKILIIAGPTASGKTAVAVELAKKIGGEVVSADSMQVYRGLDIGTAKPTAEEMAGIPHHMIDIVNPDEPFSVAEYQARAIKTVREIHSRGNIPILAGGTGFYINAVLYSTDFSEISHEENRREQEMRENYVTIAREKGAEFLHTELAEKDPAYAATIHPNNVRRVARALAYCKTTGNLFSAYNAAQKAARHSAYDADFYVLSMHRENLYTRINARTKAMFDAGLVEEVRGLLAKGYHKGLAPIRGIGYKETVQFISGEMSEPEAIAAMGQATRNYAKRQETWFRNQSADAIRIDAEGKSLGIAERILRMKGR